MQPRHDKSTLLLADVANRRGRSRRRADGLDERDVLDPDRTWTAELQRIDDEAVHLQRCDGARGRDRRCAALAGQQQRRLDHAQGYPASVERSRAAAVLAALDYRRRTGKGQYLDQSQTETALPFIEPLLLDYFVNGRIANRDGNRLHHVFKIIKST